MMILAYHLILSAYGFWLPNDPRGSWSDFVRAYEVYRAGGDATKFDTRRSVANRRGNPELTASAKRALARPPVTFTGPQAKAIALGFADYAKRSECGVHACSILPDHAHLVVGRHRLPIEKLCDQFKAAATAQLNREGLHPFLDQPYDSGRLPSPWARKGWWVFLDSVRDVERSVRYVEDNPVKTGLRRQKWSFVTPFER